MFLLVIKINQRDYSSKDKTHVRRIMQRGKTQPYAPSRGPAPHPGPPFHPLCSEHPSSGLLGSATPWAHLPFWFLIILNESVWGPLPHVLPQTREDTMLALSFKSQTEHHTPRKAHHWHCPQSISLLSSTRHCGMVTNV